MVNLQRSKTDQFAYTKQYKIHEITTSSPEDLLLHLYDFAIQSCIRKDVDRTSNALAELIDSLNFEYQDISGGLFRLYEYIMRCVKQNEFEIPLDLLKKLRETWNQAIASRKAA